jgi:hypothetical protein
MQLKATVQTIMTHIPCVEVRELAVIRDGRRAPRGTASRNLCYPCCFRDSSEIRPRSASDGTASATRGEPMTGTG